MPYCPNCRDEFEDWVDTCPDCNVPLVDTLPPEPEIPVRTGNLVVVATVQGDIEAQLWKGILEDEGIHSLVRVAESLNLYVSPLLLNHEILVLEDDVERAKEILGSDLEFEEE